jgi:DNA-binding transcriptional MerR regulator
VLVEEHDAEEGGTTMATNAEVTAAATLATQEPELSLTVQQTAERTGLSEHTLRYYERAGLLDPIRRHDSSRHRRYSASDLARIQTLACLRATGMPLDQMRRYFDLAAQGSSAAPELIALLKDQQVALQDRLEQLQRHVVYVKHKIAYWRAVEAHDGQAAAIARRLAGQILADAQCPPDNSIT